MCFPSFRPMGLYPSFMPVCRIMLSVRPPFSGILTQLFQPVLCLLLGHPTGCWRSNFSWPSSLCFSHLKEYLTFAYYYCTIYLDKKTASYFHAVWNMIHHGMNVWSYMLELVTILFNLMLKNSSTHLLLYIIYIYTQPV